MTRYEYKVVPAPKKGEKARGVKTPEDRFAHTLASLMNLHGADGWEYLRTDTLPAEERSGLTGRTTVFQNMLVFRRVLDVEAQHPAPARPRVVPMPDPVPEPTPEPPRPPQAADGQEPTVVPVRRDPEPGPSPRLGPANGGLAGE
ncbi:DUF4177 domain-containing protein [Frigidibacter sp. ROC022]|uniref:DUF4177 domain-containing protein n=1 Tax=Frigidibacter sp. ROC022 TaxID=2971796 RepID=UPI00215A5574|nr:DUF4177 domain-containing protein [Frigidibacter sp. ROC022]MCR8725338.1 DUF4177 domain-containing protein [Frigidibacter sp. ROC022]